MILMFLLSIVIFFLGYFLYAKYISRVIGISRENKVPSVEKMDGIDYVPTNKFVLFGHHFASIAGAGPILGPIIAISMYGWGPVWLWVLLGGVFFGAVHDFLSLAISVKNQGRSIFDISKDVLGKFASLFMLVFVLLALIIVVAVFAAFTAVTFVSEPRIVIPTATILVVALLASLMIYKLKLNIIISTVISLFIVALSIFVSFSYNIGILLPFDKETSITVWILILLAYSLIASILPVNLILQPRDYINSYILFIGMFFGILGIIFFNFLNFDIKIPFLQVTEIAKDPSTDLLEPIWPILFITVACGAISGFHSLVASGTTSKQIANEENTRFVAYGGMLTESLLAVTVILGTIFFLTPDTLVKFVKEGKGIIAFGNAYNGLTQGILGSFGLSLAILMINGFMLTTLDTATRISRFLLEEIYLNVSGRKLSKFKSVTIILIVAGYLALSGAYVAIWKLFGTANQLVSAFALIVITLYLLYRGKTSWFAFIPAIFMVATTLGSLIFYFYKYAFDSFNITFLIIDTILLVVALIAYTSIIFSVIRKKGK
ncbi:MAG: carbon starvation protein A [Brevinematales bacterium]|nr:carbon starvation protein A [Brevinematales bacterium]